MIRMARLKNALTGVVVEVSDEKVGRLSREWQPVVTPEPQPSPDPRPRRTKK